MGNCFFLELFEANQGGRPALLLGLVGGAAHALGVKVATDHLVGVRVDLDAQVVDRFEHSFQADHPDAPLGDETFAKRLPPLVELILMSPDFQWR